MRSIDTMMAEGKAKPKRTPARRGRLRFAPVLSSLLDDLVDRGLPGKAGAGDAQVLRLARAELRAVLAVVDAATCAEAVLPSGCWGYDPKTKRCRCALHRAIETLEEVRHGR